MKKILFVHDLQESPAPRQNILEMAGFEVKTMASSRELFVHLRAEQPDLILLDVLIEGKNGFEAALEIKAKQLGRSTPIVICSRIYRTRQFRELARKNGSQDYILLPVQLDEFLRRINKALSDFEPPLETRVA